MGIKQKQLEVYDDWAAADGQSKSVNDIQHGGNHYKNRAIQPWDYVIANEMGYLEGTIVKYITRYKDKNGVEDLMKARHFLDKLIEVTNERS